MREKDYQAILSSIDDAIAVFERQRIRSPSDAKVYHALRALRQSVRGAQDDVVEDNVRPGHGDGNDGGDGVRFARD
jgi:hypothetical protein